MAKIVRRDPPPSPPPMFDIFDLSLEEMQALKIISDHSYLFRQYLLEKGKADLRGCTGDLAELFHAIVKAGV